MMRIITGKARGIKLRTLEGDTTRPTAERVKEAVFSMLQFEMENAEVLDLFAGSGQMGLEAVSRGARRAVFCDAERRAVEIVRQNAAATKLESSCEIFCADYRAILKRLRGGDRKFSIVILDPPYALGAIPEALRLLHEYGLLAPYAKIVCESASPDDVFAGDDALKELYTVTREARYGIVHITVLAPGGKEDAQ